MWEHLQKNMLFLWDLEGPSCFRSLGNWVAPSKWKVLPLLYVLLLYLMPFSNQTIQKKMRGRKRSKTVQCMICLAVSADSSSKDSFAPCRWDGQEKKKRPEDFFFFEGWGFCPTSLQKSKTWWEPRATLENSNDLCYIINNLIGLTLQISTWSWLEITGPNQFYYWNSRPQVALWWPDVITQP